jgi:hypothetical protein
VGIDRKQLLDVCQIITTRHDVRSRIDERSCHIRMGITHGQDRRVNAQKFIDGLGYPNISISGMECCQPSRPVLVAIKDQDGES